MQLIKPFRGIGGEAVERINHRVPTRGLAILAGRENHKDFPIGRRAEQVSGDRGGADDAPLDSHMRRRYGNTRMMAHLGVDMNESGGCAKRAMNMPVVIRMTEWIPSIVPIPSF